MKSDVRSYGDQKSTGWLSAACRGDMDLKGTHPVGLEPLC